MFIIFLRFAGNKARSGQFMSGHQQWLQPGFDDGVFLLAGSLEPGLGGGILPQESTRADIERRVNAAPFLVENVVSAEIHELDSARAEDRLRYLVPA